MQRSHNTTLPKVTYDQQAKFGAKGKNKFWYGFKKHVSVDIQSGLINKIALTCQHYRCQWLTKLVKSGFLMIIRIYAKVSLLSFSNFLAMALSRSCQRLAFATRCEASIKVNTSFIYPLDLNMSLTSSKILDKRRAPIFVLIFEKIL
jgi:hypothetical protein